MLVMTKVTRQARANQTPKQKKLWMRQWCYYVNSFLGRPFFLKKPNNRISWLCIVIFVLVERANVGSADAPQHASHVSEIISLQQRRSLLLFTGRAGRSRGLAPLVQPQRTI
jgi:hypothetical protein